MNTPLINVPAPVRLLLATVLATVMMITGAMAAVQKRVALVIGNSAYTTAPELINPKNDATDMAAKLRNLGFDVVEGQDLDYRNMRKTVRKFIGKTENADVALFFYAGHGLQVNGQNYLMPVDAQLAEEDDLDFEAMPVKMVLNAMERNSKATLLFLDACRNNPLGRGLARSMGVRSSSVGSGLAEIGSGVGTLISFATKPGAVALDGEGRNSPFTTALLKHIDTPNQDITRTLVSVRRDVLASTNSKQVPWENSSLTNRVVLLEEKKAEPQVVAALTPQPATAGAVTPQPHLVTPQPNPNGGIQVELVFWSSVERDNTAEGYRQYLAKYPNGQFSGLARLRAAQLEVKAKSPQGTQELAKTAPVPPAPDTTIQVQPHQQLKQPEVKVAGLGETTVPTTSVPAVTNQTANLQAPAQPVAPSGLSDRDRVFFIQTELARLGCSPGRPDGLAGRKTLQAVDRFSRYSGVPVVLGDYSDRLLYDLRQQKAKVCPTPRKSIAAVAPVRKKALKSRAATRTQALKPNWKKKRVKRAKVKPARKVRTKRVVKKKRIKRKRVVRAKPRRVVKVGRHTTAKQRKKKRNAAIGAAIAIGAAAIILGSRRRR